MSNTDFLYHQGRSIHSRCHPSQNHSLYIKNLTLVSQSGILNEVLFSLKKQKNLKKPENGTKEKITCSRGKHFFQYQVSKRQQTRSVGRRMHVRAYTCPSLRDRVSVVKANHARAVHHRGITYRLNHPRSPRPYSRPPHPHPPATMRHTIDCLTVIITRKHSSRMPIARLATVCASCRGWGLYRWVPCIARSKVNKLEHVWGGPVQ